MNDEDRRYLTEWGGECWHDAENDETCTKCGKSFRGYYFDSVNRPFDNWEDYGWLIAKLKQKQQVWDFADSWNDQPRFLDAPVSQMTEWLITTPDVCCQLICDFLRKQEAGDANG